MMKKKLVSVFAAMLMVLMAMFSLAGCKVQSSAPPENPFDTKPDDNSATASVHLTVGTLIDDPETALMTAWINAFQKKHKNVSIKLGQSYEGMTSLTAYKTAGTLDDITWTAGDQHSLYSQGGYFQDLSDETKFPGSAEFFSGFYDEIFATTHYNNIDTGVWFVPRDYNRITIFYNKDAFDRMGVKYPKDGWTWAQFEETCKQLTTPADDGTVCSYAIEWRDWGPIYSSLMKNYNSQYVDNEGYVALDSDGTRELYTYLKDTFFRKYARWGEGASFKAYSSKNPKKVIGAAMYVDTYAKMGSLASAATRLNWKIDAVSFPAITTADNGKGYTGVGCSGYAITTACTDPEKLEWAWKFLKYCMSEEGYNDVANIGVVCPALKSMRHDGEWTKYEASGSAINYNAFVDDSTEDVGLNYFNVLASTSQQAELVGWADTFWKSLQSSETGYNAAVKDFVDSYEGEIKKRQ